MKIALNALQVRGAKSGVGHYIACLLEALLDVDTTNAYLTFASPYNYFNYQFQSPRYQLEIWGSRSKRKTIRLLYEYAFLPRAVRKHNVDLFHGPSNLLPLRKVVPYVLTIHDMSYFVDPRRYTRTKVMYWHAVSRRSAKLADYIITDSDYSKQDIIRYLDYPSDRIRVIAMAAHPRFRPILNHVALEEFRARYGLEGPYALCVGTLEPGKNLFRVVRAFAQLRNQGAHEYHLVLVGDKGWLYQDIFAEVRQLGLEKEVHALGHIPDDDLPLAYNCAELFVFPSLNEGFGLPVLEAMACGVPVVTSNCSALPEVAGDAACLVDPYDERAIAQAMQSVLSDTGKREELIQKGLRRSAMFSWERTARETLEVYEAVAQERR
jgi:glycosyltransferase involved in cell wall biosynthesis